MKVGRILSKDMHGLDAIDVELLLMKVLGITRANLKAYPERELTIDEYKQFDELLSKRLKGEPIAYIIGHREFWSLDFIVTKDVLIPRSDSELLVEIALENMEGRMNLRVLDLGTGSGAIALAIAKERPDVTVIATDASLEALQVAQQNAKNFELTNVEFALGNWYQALNAQVQTFDIIVSNPPYIANLDPHLNQGDLRFEPKYALVSGEDGMDDLRKIILNAPKHLLAGGMLIIEHGYDQEQLVYQEFAQANFSSIVCYKDLNGMPRVTSGLKGD